MKEVERGLVPSPDIVHNGVEKSSKPRRLDEIALAYSIALASMQMLQTMLDSGISLDDALSQLGNTDAPTTNNTKLADYDALRRRKPPVYDTHSRDVRLLYGLTENLQGYVPRDAKSTSLAYLFQGYADTDPSEYPVELRELLDLFKGTVFDGMSLKSLAIIAGKSELDFPRFEEENPHVFGKSQPKSIPEADQPAVSTDNREPETAEGQENAVVVAKRSQRPTTVFPAHPATRNEGPAENFVLAENMADLDAAMRGMSGSRRSGEVRTSRPKGFSALPSSAKEIEAFLRAHFPADVIDSKRGSGVENPGELKKFEELAAFVALLLTPDDSDVMVPTFADIVKIVNYQTLREEDDEATQAALLERQTEPTRQWIKKFVAKAGAFIESASIPQDLPRMQRLMSWLSMTPLRGASPELVEKLALREITFDQFLYGFNEEQSAQVLVQGGLIDIPVIIANAQGQMAQLAVPEDLAIQDEKDLVAMDKLRYAELMEQVNAEGSQAMLQAVRQLFAISKRGYVDRDAKSIAMHVFAEELDSIHSAEVRKALLGELTEFVEAAREEFVETFTPDPNEDKVHKISLGKWMPVYAALVNHPMYDLFSREEYVQIAKREMSAVTVLERASRSKSKVDDLFNGAPDAILRV